MFPISDSAKSGRIPFVTLAIIAVNIFVFYEQLNAPSQEAFIFEYALIPSTVSFFNFQTLIPFITSMFLHGGFFHILSNMWFLWIFGDNVEARLGILKFTLLYLAAGVAGNFIQFILAPNSDIPMLGASGAVSGILASYFIFFPTSSIKTFLFMFFFVTIREIPAVIYIFYWFIIQLFSGIISLPLTFASGGIAFWAHVGGFVTGILMARSWKSRGRTADVIEGEIIE